MRKAETAEDCLKMKACPVILKMQKQVEMEKAKVEKKEAKSLKAERDEAKKLKAGREKMENLKAEKKEAESSRSC